MVPEIRINKCNDAPVSTDGDYVLYWMIASRRLHWNFSLDHACAWAKRLQKPLVIFEALRCDYPWASDRLHRFVLDGMLDNLRAARGNRVTYYPYVEPAKDAGKELLEAVAKQACVIITDDFPCFFLPRMVKAAAAKVSVRLEAIDSNGLLPMRAAPQVFARAYDFRRFLQKTLQIHLGDFPNPEPLSQELPMPKPLPSAVTERWPATTKDSLLDKRSLKTLPIDHAVLPGETSGGSTAAVETLRQFIDKKLMRYDTDRNEPELDGTSNLSPYLHFGHISIHQVFAEIARVEDWNLRFLPPKGTGSRSGWWGMSRAAEAFLDELITWRELGYNMCSRQSDYNRYESLPDWARQTLAEHEPDSREYVYSLSEFEASKTHDPLWNAAQRQLDSEGRIHNYLRMLWGKKILEWSETPRQALEIMIHLNNKYALDGRNPNSYSGIFWVLGRYDRAWGPERAVFGKIRYMSSENTARKVGVKNYIEKYQQDALAHR